MKIYILFLAFLFLYGCNRSVLNNQNSNSIPAGSENASNEPMVQTTTDIPEETTGKDSDGASEISTGENLCKYNEEILFSFELSESHEIVSVCISKAKPGFIVCRYGKKDDLKLDFPDNKDNSWSKFSYSHYLRGGGADNEGADLNYLNFEYEGSSYVIYQEYTATANITNVGVRITNRTTATETDLKGLSETIIGSLINLRNNKNMQRQELQ